MPVTQGPTRSRERQPDELWRAFVDAKHRANTTLRLTDMREAVEAYEAWLSAMIPDERARREVWP